ncbi:hypothetical protein BJV74DRAFT_400572 [Russula compacta]|nr:hypothetical protein BJV74DRAFT_400572 [Russula compacta]
MIGLPTHSRNIIKRQLTLPSRSPAPSSQRSYKYYSHSFYYLALRNDVQQASRLFGHRLRCGERRRRVGHSGDEAGRWYHRHIRQHENECDTGSVHCCDTVTPITDPMVGTLEGLFDVPLNPSLPVGLTCTAAEGGALCTNTPTCCNGVAQAGQGYININCSPVTINL